MRQRTVALFLLISFLLATAAWGREDRLTNTGAAPAAEGKVITDNDRNGNTGIEIHVKHMATPQSLTPARQTYLVWVQPRGKDPELLGALRVNEDLEGSLKAATTLSISSTQLLVRQKELPALWRSSAAMVSDCREPRPARHRPRRKGAGIAAPAR